MELPVRIKEALSPTVTLDEVTFIPDASKRVQPEYIQDIMPDPQQHLTADVVSLFPDAHFQLQPGKRFTIKEKDLQRLGRSGEFGVVLFGKDNNLHSEVAVKFLRPPGLRPENDPNATIDFSQKDKVETWRKRVDNFYREARELAKVNHNHIVKVYDLVATKLGGEVVPGLVMEKLAPLKEDLSPSEVVTMVDQISSALDFLHSKGLFHKDVKPQNILTRDNNGRVEYVLGDFGAIYKTNLEENDYNLEIGTENYADPQRQYDIDDLPETKHYADQYALAVTAHKLLSGINDGSNIRIRHTPIDHTLLEPSDKISPAVMAVLEKATSYQREDRYASCGEFAQALAEAVRQSEMGEDKKERKGFTKITGDILAKIMKSRSITEGSARQSLQTIAKLDVPEDEGPVDADKRDNNIAEEVSVK